MIRDGATLTETAEDVIAGLGNLARGFHEPDGPGRALAPADERETDRIRQALSELLGPAPTEIDELVRQCRAETSAVLAALLELELAGRVQRHPGGRFSTA